MPIGVRDFVVLGERRDWLRGLISYRPMPGPQTEFHKSKASIRALVGGTGCLGAGELIYDPVDGTRVPVSERTKPFHVWTALPRNDGSTRHCPSRTCLGWSPGAFRKESADIYRCSLTNGQSFECTLEHKVKPVARDVRNERSAAGWDWWVTVKEAMAESLPLASTTQFPETDSVFHVRMCRLEFVRRDHFYDFTVDPGHCYFHAGILHKNSGKTRPCGADIAAMLLVGHRLKRLPVHAWVVRPSLPDHYALETDPIYRQLCFGDERFAAFIPPEFLLPLAGRMRAIRLVNGSTLQVRSWGQGTALQMGHEPDVVWIDEECAESMYQELHARLMRRSNAQMIISLAPVQNQPWVLKLMEQAKRGHEGVAFWTLDAMDNVHLDAKQRALVVAGLDEGDYETRIRGQPRQLHGRLYKDWTDRNWRDLSDLPDDGSDYVFIDIGISNPCAALWVRRVAARLAVVDGREVELHDYWCHREYYKRGESNWGNHLDRIMEVNAGLKPVTWYIDPWDCGKRVNSAQAGTEGLRILDVWNEAASKYNVEIVPLPVSRRANRLERFLTTRQVIDLGVKDGEIDQTREHVYALREMWRLRDELLYYACKGNIMGPSAIGKARSEEFTDNNHLIFGLEFAVLLSVPYRSLKTAALAGSTPALERAKAMWENFGGDDDSGIPDGYAAPQPRF